MITKPNLPPKLGYTETIDKTGSPVYRKIQVEGLEQLKLLQSQIQAQTERSDFIEDCIAEMATQVYGGV